MPEKSAEPMTAREALLFFDKWLKEETKLWFKLESARFCEIEGACFVREIEPTGLIHIRIFVSADLSFNIADASTQAFGSSADSSKTFLNIWFDSGSIGFAEMFES